MFNKKIAYLVGLLRPYAMRVNDWRKWGQIRGKLDLDWVSKEFELTNFELADSKWLGNLILLELTRVQVKPGSPVLH